MFGIKKLLPFELLPPSLWDSDKHILRISPSLAVAYGTVIDRHNLRHLSRNRDPKDPPIGGESQTRTNQHFAQQFDGSAARTQLALTDPNNDIPAVSNGMIKTISGNRVTLIDAPCGAGAAGLSLLCTIAALRASNVLPREPLDVVLIGAELSEYARTYAEELLSEIIPGLESQGIFVTAGFHEWNATCPVSTADLVKRINIAATTNPMVLVLVANFSGFLTTTNKWKETSPQLRDLFLHGSGRANFAAWLEPLTNKVTNASGLFGWVRKQLQGSWKRFAREKGDFEEPHILAQSSARFYLPLRPTETANVRLAVMPIDLVRTR